MLQVRKLRPAGLSQTAELSDGTRTGSRKALPLYHGTLLRGWISYLGLSHTTSEDAALEGSVIFQGPTGSKPPGKAGLCPMPHTAVWVSVSLLYTVVTNDALQTTLLLELRGE